MEKIRRLLTIFIASIICFTLVSETVMAGNTGNVSCTAGGPTANSEFFSPKMVYPDYVVTNPNATDGCGTINSRKFFSGLGCVFVVNLNKIFSIFYCAVQNGMKEILATVITLYIVIFGAKLLMGTQEATLGATVLALIKLGIVVTFTTQGLFGVGLIYDFFINLMMNLVDWSVTAINCTNILDVPTCIRDAAFYNFSSVFSAIDNRVYSAIMGTDPASTGTLGGGLFSENAEMISVVIILYFICPPLFSLIASLIWMTCTFFISTFASLLMSMIVVAFLIALSPVFLSFMLFGSTYNIFDNWLRNLISYTIQPMIVFSVFSLWIIVIVDFTTFIGQFSDLTTTTFNGKPTNCNEDKGVVNSSKAGCLLFCRPRYSETPTVITLPNPPTTILPQVIIGGPSIKCCKMVDWPGPPYKDEGRMCDPADETTTLASVRNVVNESDLIQPSVIIKDSKFIYFVAYHIISLLVISSAFLNMLRMAPQIAQELSKSQSHIPLGAGFNRPSSFGSLLSRFSSSVSDGISKPINKGAKTAAEKANALMGRTPQAAAATTTSGQGFSTPAAGGQRPKP